ncbi:MAG: hypothetical protein QF412_08695 [Planctomycetota bacterium]|jgi:hypothetical protein|nr:hypothetical protein [Planctomycetota bacterium]
MNSRHIRLLAWAAMLTSASTITAQGGAPRPGPTVDWGKLEHRIAWYGTVESALAAVERTGRPLLVMSAQPHCHGTPGIW